jgi:hypothetical protein
MVNRRLDLPAAMNLLKGMGSIRPLPMPPAHNLFTTKDTKSTKGYKMKRLMPFFSFVTLKLISSPVLTPANFM